MLRIFLLFPLLMFACESHSQEIGFVSYTAVMDTMPEGKDAAHKYTLYVKKHEDILQYMRVLFENRSNPCRDCFRVVPNPVNYLRCIEVHEKLLNDWIKRIEDSTTVFEERNEKMRETLNEELKSIIRVKAKILAYENCLDYIVDADTMPIVLPETDYTSEMIKHMFNRK